MAWLCLRCIVSPPCANKWFVALLSNRAACRCSNPRRADYPDIQGNQGNRRRPYQIRVIPFASRRPKPPAAFSTPQGIALRRRAMQGNGARRRAMCACVCALSCVRVCVWGALSVPPVEAGGRRRRRLLFSRRRRAARWVQLCVVHAGAGRVRCLLPPALFPLLRALIRSRCSPRPTPQS